MSKKKVTAPLTYNPGKGRPKEHLAYLNYQEMQALKRLNGNNQERGPRGLPSFPPAGAMSGGSAKSPASTSKAAGAGSRPSSGRPSGGMMGGTGSGGSVRTSPSSGSGIGGGGGGGGGFKPGPSGGPKAPSFGGGGGSGVTSSANRGASPGSIGRSDKAAINAVNSANTKAALKTPAISADRPRTLNVGPMGTPVSVKTGQAGSQIKGAIKSVKQGAKPETRSVNVPKSTVVPTSPGAGGGFGRVDSAQKSLMRGSLTSPVGPASGVTAPRDAYGALQERLNQRNISEFYRSQTGYPSAPQGVYGPRAGVDTRYLGTKDMPGMITTSMTSPYSGTVAPRSNAASTLRAYEAAKRKPGKIIQDRVPPTERFRSVPRVPDISVPSPEQSLYTGAGQFDAPTGKKQIYDRVLPESQYSGYGSFKPPSAPGKTRGIGDVPQQYPNTPPAGLSVRSPAYDPSRLAAYDSPFGPELLGASGSEIEKALLNEEFRRQAAGTVTSPYDVAPSYPNYGPPSNNRGLGGLNPATSKINGYEVYNPADYENSLAIQTPSWKQSPAYSYNPNEEGFVDEATAEDYGLVGEEAADAAKKAGFPRSVFTNEDFLNDPDQLGLTREEIATPLSPEDMAKVVNRSRALRYDDVEPYLTGPEKVRAKVSDVVERIITFGAPTKVAVGTAKKLMSIEGPEKFLSRPSYEQQALYEYAREANTRYRPGEAGVPQVGGPGNSGVIGGGSGLGGDGFGGGDKGNSGIASLVDKPKGDETTTPTPDTPSTTPGRRPDIYYMWDLGVNIPSPGDPNYTQYQTYLAERLSARQAVG